MTHTDFQNQILTESLDCDFKLNEPMSRHTSFRIGGNAEIMAFPKNPQQMQQVLDWCARTHCKAAVLGAGTNVLAPDEGLGGMVICLKDALDGMKLLENGEIRVMAGVTMSRAAVFAANHGLSGMEFAHGIPGTVGGGVFMNAGAYGGEICNICKKVEIMDRYGNFSWVSGESMDFSYRHSALEGSDNIVISAVFALTPGNPDDIKAKMKELMAKRSASQPLDMPSAGSAFKRPAQGYASRLIDEAGLRGYQVGGAAVSQKHTGFAVNMGNATAADVRELLKQVSDIVYEKTKIRLEPEVRIW